jgi:hypothetical protein
MALNRDHVFFAFSVGQWLYTSAGAIFGIADVPFGVYEMAKFKLGAYPVDLEPPESKRKRESLYRLYSEKLEAAEEAGASDSELTQLNAKLSEYENSTFFLFKENPDTRRRRSPTPFSMKVKGDQHAKEEQLTLEPGLYCILAASGVGKSVMAAFVANEGGVSVRDFGEPGSGDEAGWQELAIALGELLDGDDDIAVFDSLSMLLDMGSALSSGGIAREAQTALLNIDRVCKVRGLVVVAVVNPAAGPSAAKGIRELLEARTSGLIVPIGTSADTSNRTLTIKFEFVQRPSQRAGKLYTATIRMN